METEIEETIINNCQKTENNEIDSNNAVSNSSPKNLETLLHDFLEQKPNNTLPMFQSVINHEEEEAKERDPPEDLKTYRDACADFADVVLDIAEIKVTKPEEWKDKVNELRKEAAFVSVIMKKLNRVEKTRTKMLREKVNKERLVVDTAQLKLDNLLCEVQHMKKEIDKCLKFKSRPLGIDLVPVQEFYEKSPVSISKPESTKNNEHLLQLARLEWELKQRKELSTLLSDLENKKSTIIEQIEKKEKDLNSLAPLIKEVLVVTQPLQDKLGLTPHKNNYISEYASLLPEPLYFLYIQSVAYSDACDKDITVEIKGSIPEARRIKSLPLPDLSISECDSDMDEESIKTEKINIEVERQKLFEKHPLTVVLRFLIKEGNRLELQFYFFRHLNILTVMPTLNVSPAYTSSSLHDLLNGTSLLKNLFSGDSGTDSPNLRNYYQLKKVGVDCFNSEKYGAPYIWVQKIGGLDFIGLTSKIEPKQDISRANMPIIIKELKRRVHYKLSALSIITGFERGDVPAPSSMKNVQLNCSLKSWKEFSWAEICENPSLKHISESCLVSQNDTFFKGVITQADAKLIVYTAIKSDYPLCPSAIFLQMLWENNKWTSQNNSKLLNIEEEINIHWKELLTSRAEVSLSLGFQIFRTMAYFDILLESLNAVRFPSKKNIEKLYRGRKRNLPFKFLSENSLFVHRS